MVYNFEEKVVNKNDVNHFYDKNNFVGYILPDGSIYKCQNHNVSNVDTVLNMYLMLFKDHYSDKDKLLRIETDDKLLKLIVNYLKRASYDEIMALSRFIEENKLLISDLIVSLFGCHLVTRLNRTILTSECNHECFYNYLLNDFTIYNIDKMYYDSKNKVFKYAVSTNRNDYLYDEIENIKRNVDKKDIDLFYKIK